MRMSGIVQTVKLGLFTLMITAIAAPAYSDCCSLNGGPCNIIADPGLIHGTSPWTGSVCPTTIDGENCNARLDTTDGSASSGDCITLGEGVTFDLNGRTITCTSGSCGSAVVNTDSGGAAAEVIIKNGFMSGCWHRGVLVSGGTNSSVEDLNVDLARSGGGSCTGGGFSAGIFQPRGTISRTVAKNGFTGIYPEPGEDITDSIVADNLVGIGNLGASSADVDITNVQFLNNTYDMKNLNPGVYLPDAENVSMQGTGVCNCINASNVCQDIDDCLDFPVTTPGRASFIGEAILP